MLAKLFLQFVLASVFGVGMDDGYATLYGTPDDPWAQGLMACTHRRVPQNQRLCAHRWLPCGTEITVVNLDRKKTTVGSCTVADRGPFGVEKASGRWRGLIDLTPAAARSVRLNNRNLVRLLYRLPKSDHPVYDRRNFLQPRKGTSGPVM